MGNILGSWSGMRKYLEKEMLADSLKNRVRLQNEGNYDKMYVMIADSQALTDNFGNVQKVKDNVLQVMLDYMAVGLDPNKVHLFVHKHHLILCQI